MKKIISLFDAKFSSKLKAYIYNLGQNCWNTFGLIVEIPPPWTSVETWFWGLMICRAGPTGLDQQGWTNVAWWEEVGV